MKDNTMQMAESTSGCPWLSVIIPIYNAEKYLEFCLKSIQRQTFCDYEVLLIDDGSKDSSSDICKKYADLDKRFRYIRKENGGSFQSRIFGAERTLGKYITFCDADDYYLNKNAFERMYEELNGDKYDVLQFSITKRYNHMKKRDSAVKTAISVDKDGFLSKEYPKLLCSFWDSAHLSPNLWNKVYHRRLLLNLPHSDVAERIFWGDDLISNLYLLSTCNSLRLIPESLYCYRQFSGDTNKFSKTTMRDLDNIKKYQLMFLEKYQSENKEKIESVLFSEVAGWLFVQIKQALNCISEEEVVEMIEQDLQYPRFILAREYYLNNEQETMEIANLLRNADAREYIKKAKEQQGKRSIKESVVKLLKRIYMAI